MAVRTVLVCETQVPFVEGGAERLVRQLAGQFRAHGYRTEIVSVPFAWSPKREILAHAAAWRLLDLTESHSIPVDLVVATKFPTYFVRHPNKVTWLTHQFRAAYELCGTPYSDFGETGEEVGLRGTIFRLDREMLSESRRLFTISRTTSRRLERHLGLEAGVLYHPPALAPRLRGGPAGDYILSVGRLEAGKRVGLLVEALARGPASLRLVVAGEGGEREALASRAEALGIADRVLLLGQVDDDRLVELYAGALAVGFPPFDEDYGYVTLEAFLAGKPVITTTDAGGPLEFVEDGVSGCVAEPDPEALGACFAALDADRRRAAEMGAAGRDRARAITWDGVVERLAGGGEA